MQQTRTMELGTGLFALLGIGALFFLTTQTTGSDDFNVADTYEVSARFDNIGSLKARAPVSMSGVTIGRVTDIRFDPESLEAVVTFVIDSRYDQIPDDSDASILTAGLLGSQYVGLTAGGSPLFLEDGSEILFTQSAIVLENIIGKFLIGGTSGSEEGSEE
jgi:phospholipid/cholesterol/gamma-HCH transport system substrate-binding protein